MLCTIISLPLEIRLGFELSETGSEFNYHRLTTALLKVEHKRNDCIKCISICSHVYSVNKFCIIVTGVSSYGLTLNQVHQDPGVIYSVDEKSLRTEFIYLNTCL